MATNLGDGNNNWGGFGPFDDVVFGQGGNDTLRGGDGNDELHGGSSDDRIFGDAGTDKLFGDSGNDILFSFNPQGSPDPLQDDDVSDAAFDRDGGSTIDGGSGDDIIVVSHDFHGTMRVIGGEGFDRLTFDGDSNFFTNPTDRINIVDLGNGTGLTPFNRPLVISGIEEVDGDFYQDRLLGDAHNNVLKGEGGNDVLDGRTGADNLIGGSGIDTASYASSAAAISINLFGNSQSGGDAAGDRLSEIEGIIGSKNADVIVGNNLNNVLKGADGNDHLEGAAGFDVLDGGAGTDIADYHLASEGIVLTLGLNGADGSTIEHGARLPNTSAVTPPPGQTVVIDPGDAFAPGTTDTLRSIENANGSQFDDVLTGNQATNILNGAKGNDRLDGGSGIDTIRGGDGDDILSGGPGGAAVVIRNIVLSDNDFIDGGNGIDRLVYARNAGAVSVQLGLNGADGQALESGPAGNGLHSTDVIRAVENVTGSLFSDVIAGNEQNNVLIGGAGNDTLNGGDGRDTMTGNSGNDVFNFSGLSSSPVPPNLFVGDVFGGDQIVDFNHSNEHDNIDLSAVDADSTLAGDQAFRFVGGFTGQAGDLIQTDTFPPNSSSRGHAILGDIDGDGAADFGIDLLNGNNLVLTAADFVL